VEEVRERIRGEGPEQGGKQSMGWRERGGREKKSREGKIDIVREGKQRGTDRGERN